MSGVLEVGSKRREDNNKKILNGSYRRFMRIGKPVKFITPPGSSSSLNLHYSFQEWIIETKNEMYGLASQPGGEGGEILLVTSCYRNQIKQCSTLIDGVGN